MIILPGHENYIPPFPRVGNDINITKDESVAIKIGAEVGTDGGKVFINSPGENSLEASTDIKGNLSGNITLLGISVVGQQMDEGKATFELGKGVYVKTVVDNQNVLPKLTNIKETISQIGATYNTTVKKYDKEEIF